MNGKKTMACHTTILAAALVLALAPAARSGAPHGTQWEPVGPLVWEAEHDEPEGGESGQVGEEMEGSGAWVRRNRNSVDGRVIATELTPGHVYTLHFVIFNNPDACTFGQTPEHRCGMLDVFLNPAADGSFMWADGQLARQSTVEFRAHRKVKTKSRIWFGNGLTNPDGADVLFELFDMGLPIPEHLRDQRTSATFGCGEGEPNHEGSVGGFCRDLAGTGV